MMSKFQRALRAIKHMVAPYHPPRRPTFLTDDELIVRQLAQRDLLGDVQPKGLGPKRTPIDYDDGLPNG